jgi:hypothetical protein
MSRTLRGLGLLTLLALMMNVEMAHAQAAAETTTKPAIPLRYDISKDVELNATVESVPSKSSGGLLQSGSNVGFVLQTSSGPVQGRLTPFVLNGKGAISISVGDHVQVTGVMMTVKNDRQVFVIRTITVGGRTYAIRNERGFPLEHPALNAATSTASKGGQR